MFELFTVDYDKGFRAFRVKDPCGNEIAAYRDKATAHKVAFGATHGMFNGAEEYDLRFVAARRYLAARRERAARPDPQLSLFA